MGIRSCFRYVGNAVPVVCITLTAVLLSPAAAPPVAALSGGDGWAAAVPAPCTTPCTFPAGNQAAGLSAFPVGDAANEHASWFRVDVPGTTAYTFRAVTDGSWHATLVLTDLDGNVLAADDDAAGRHPAVTAFLGTGSYAVALAGHGTEDTGTAMLTISMGTPDVPADVVATAGEASLTVQWTAPDDHGDAITEYRVYLDGGTDPLVVPGTDTSADVPDVVVGHPVTAQVTAVNAQGESARSAASLVAVPYASTTVSISFDPTSVSWPSTFTVTATVTAPVPVDEGVMAFYRNGTKVATAAVRAGAASYTAASLPPGTYTLNANYEGTPIFGSSGTSRNITVAKAAQAITFDAVDDVALGTGSVAVTASATSALTVAVTTLTGSVCTVRSRSVTLLTTGTCTLTATQAGNAYYAAAAAVTRSFVVLDDPTTTSTTTTSTTTTTTTTTTTPAPTTTTTSTLPVTQPGTSTTTSSSTTVPSSTTSTPVPATSTTAAPTTTTAPTTTSTTVPPRPALTTFAAVTVAGPAVLTAGRTLAVRVAGTKVPATGAAAAAVVLTVSNSIGNGRVLVAACTATDGPTAVVAPGRATRLTALVPLATGDGRVCLRSTATVSFRLEVTGWAATGGSYHAVATTPALWSGTMSAGTHRVQVTGRAGIAAGTKVQSVVVHVLATGGAAATSVSAGACGTRGAAVLDVPVAGAASNLAVVPVDAAGAVCVTVSRSVPVRLVLSGWTSAGAFHPTTTRLLDTRRHTAIAPGTTLQVPVPGAVKSGAASIVVAVTTSSADGAGTVRIGSCGAAAAAYAPVNPRASTSTATVVAVARGAAMLCVSTTRRAHVVVDLTGWFDTTR